MVKKCKFLPKRQLLARFWVHFWNQRVKIHLGGYFWRSFKEKNFFSPDIFAILGFYRHIFFRFFGGKRCAYRFAFQKVWVLGGGSVSIFRDICSFLSPGRFPSLKCPKIHEYPSSGEKNQSTVIYFLYTYNVLTFYAKKSIFDFIKFVGLLLDFLSQLVLRGTSCKGPILVGEKFLQVGPIR